MLIHSTATLALLDRLHPPDLEHRSNACVVLARDKTPLRAFADPRGIWRYPITMDQVSPLYLQALVTYEDRYFFRHPGVNPLAVGRALFQNLDRGRIVSGGSTLTMQTARILFPTLQTPGKNGWRIWFHKGIQVLRALQLEWRYTKEEILGLYLTHAPFGGNVEGVWAAAYTYLGKDPGELSRAEAALLAVLPQAPSRCRPDRHPERARRARDKVLDRMAAFGVWSKEEVARAKEEPILSLRFPPPMVAPLACRRLHKESPARAVIPSTLDYDLQVHAETLVMDYVESLAPKQSGAILVVDLRDLTVLVYAGSADFANPQRLGHVDMVRALRSPGSTLKPFVYGMAIEEGLIHSHSLLLDTPRFRASYLPENFTGGFLGPVTAAQALQMSLNIPAVQVVEALGPARFLDRLKHGGARIRFPGKPNPSLALGGAGTSLESLARLYSALGRNGLSGAPRLRPNQPIKERYLMAPGVAYIIRRILSRSLPGQEGTLPLSGGRPMAWKTGTSYGFRDAWAMGISGPFLAGVWIGRPDGTPSPGQYGAVTAIPLLRQVMESLPHGKAPDAPRPASVTRQTIAWPSGLGLDRDPGPCFQRHHAWIFNTLIPPTQWKNQALIQRIWLDNQGRRATPQCGGTRQRTLALWPEPLTPWLPPEWRNQRILPVTSSACPDLAPLTPGQPWITTPRDKSILTRPPGQTLPRIPLRVMGAKDPVFWFLNRQPIQTHANPQTPLDIPMPPPGTHELAVVTLDGQSDRISFEVKALALP